MLKVWCADRTRRSSAVGVGPSRGWRAVVAFAASFAVLGLSACDPAVEPPKWAARVVDGVVELAFCEPFAADELGADVERASGSRWREFWKATGDIRASSGDSLTMGQSGLGVTYERIDRNVVDGKSVIVVFAYVDDQQTERAWFDFAAVTESRPWAHSKDAASSEPCTEN